MPRHLVIQLARFGDVIQTKRLLLSLARAGEVHLCLDQSMLPMARLVYPDATLHPLDCHGGDARDPSRLARNRDVCRELARLDFDAVYNLNFSGMSFALARLFEPTRVRGYRSQSGQPEKDVWMERIFRLTARRALSPINLVDFWAGLADEPIDPALVNPKAEPRGGGLGVVMAGRHARRSLPPTRLATVVRAAAQGLGKDKPVRLLGSQSEKPLAREFLRSADRFLIDRTEDLCGRTSWAELFEVVAGLDCLLTPDTGTMHLAAHLGVPVLALFMGTAWAFETGPYGLGHRVWQSVCDCSPCLETVQSHCAEECKDPFVSREFLSHLAGRASGVAHPRLLGLDAAFDAIGARYIPRFGADPYAESRARLRALLAESQGLGLAQPAPDAALVDMLFQERDWMLPRPRAWALD